MAKLIYAPIGSLDGYIEDEHGRFGWAMPDEEVYSSVNDLFDRSAPTSTAARYETMVFWETASTQADQPAATREFAGSGRQLRRSRTRGRFKRCPAHGHGSSDSSKQTPSDSSNSPPKLTSRSAVPSSPARQSAPAWSTNATCSCARSERGEAARPAVQRPRATQLLDSAGSETASFTSTTA